jgi:hypothetical protein
LNEILNSNDILIKNGESSTTNIFNKTTGRGINISRKGLLNGFRDLKKAINWSMENYYIVIGSPVDYEELVADIVIKGEYIARLQMENGKDKMILEFFEEASLKKVDLVDFLNAIAEAKEHLLK